MAEVRETEFFAAWLKGLKDPRPRGKILARIDRLKLGNSGDVEPVGEGVSELRIDYGPGYRVYIKRTSRDAFTILCGGTKASQTKDIASAKAIAQALKE